MSYLKKSKEELIEEIKFLKKKEEIISRVLDSTNEIIYHISYNKIGEKHFEYVSPHVERIMGITTEKYINENYKNKILEYFHPDDLEVLLKNTKEISLKKKKQTLKYRFFNKKKDKYVWIEETVVATYKKNGKKAAIFGTAKDVTEKVEKENQLSFILENVDECLYNVKFTPNGKVLNFVSPHIKKMTGLTIKEFHDEGQSGDLIKRIHPEDISKINKNIEEGLYKKKLKNINSTFRLMPKGSKKYLWIEEHLNAKYDKKGNLKETTTILRDITNQKVVEQHLKENEEKYRNIFTKNLAGVFITENEKVVDCNNSFAKIFGYKSRVELIGKKVGKLYFSKKDREKYISDLKEKGFLTNYRIKHKGKNGEEIWISSNVSLKNNGRIEGTLVGISDQIKIEKKLKQSEKNYKELIENSPYGVFVHLQGKIIYGNKQAYKILGLNKESIKKVDFSDFILPEYKKVVSGRSKKALNGENVPFKEFKVKKPFTNSFIYVESKPRLFDFGGQKALQVVFSDITLEKELSKEKLRATIAEESNKILQKEIRERKEAEQQLIESEERYRDLFENATDLIQSVDTTGKILYVNDSWKKVMGYSQKEIENRNIFEFIHPDCMEKCQKIFGKIMKSKEGETSKVNYELQTKQGKKINVEGNASLKFKNGKPQSTRAILRNVTDEIWDKTKQEAYNNIAKIVTEKANTEEMYEAIRQELGKIMNTDVFVISYSVNTNTISFPYYYDGKKGKINKPPRTKGKGINEFLLKQKTPRLLKRKELNKIIEKGGYKLLGKKSKSFIGVPLKIKNKTIGAVSVQSYYNENEYSEKHVQILSFISEGLASAVQRAADENKIFDQSSRLNSIIENSTHLFWTYNKEKGLTSFNKNFVRYIEEAYNKKAKIDKKSKKKIRFSTKDSFDFWDEKYDKAFLGSPQYFISTKKNNKGEEIVKEVFLNPIYDNDNKVSEVSGIAHDITEKTISEQKLKESLKEKEVLLKEVHHRVKNNLQVISSILNLQSSYVKDEKTLTLLKESQNRIKSMAFIHESLYQTSDFSKINFSEYIISLSKNLVHSYGVFDDLIDLKLSVGNISLNLDLSIPCGLILNELVSNSLKYAFSKQKKGTIKIELFEKNKNIGLIVQDNGVGLPKEIDYKNTDTLGLQLVMTLVEQINGAIDLNSGNGAKYTITFKKEQ